MALDKILILLQSLLKPSGRFLSESEAMQTVEIKSNGRDLFKTSQQNCEYKWVNTTSISAGLKLQGVCTISHITTFIAIVYDVHVHADKGSQVYTSPFSLSAKGLVSQHCINPRPSVDFSHERD